jgi:hypothetical protein
LQEKAVTVGSALAKEVVIFPVAASAVSLKAPQHLFLSFRQVAAAELSVSPSLDIKTESSESILIFIKVS